MVVAGCVFHLPISMHITPGCAFSVPPCCAIGRVNRDQHVLPHALPRSRSINAQQQILQSINQKEWQPLAYCPRHRLAEKNTERRGRQQRQQSVGGNGPAEDREGEASPRRRQQQRQQGEEQTVLPAPASAPSPIIAGQDEDVVVLDDLFEELEGGRRGHPCVVHNTLAEGPTPYNDGWEWQKQV